MLETEVSTAAKVDEVLVILLRGKNYPARLGAE